jgi:hypothetical protein
MHAEPNVEGFSNFAIFDRMGPLGELGRLRALLMKSPLHIPYEDHGMHQKSSSYHYLEAMRNSLESQ